MCIDPAVSAQVRPLTNTNALAGVFVFSARENAMEGDSLERISIILVFWNLRGN